MGYAELLALDPASYTPGEIAEMASAIQRSGERLLRLIDNYLLLVQLDLMRGEFLRHERRSHPSALIAQTAKRLSQDYGREDDLRLALADAWLAIDAEGFDKIVYELVDNAFKFSKSGSPVSVTCCSDGDFYVVTVCDEGRGIAPEYIQTIGAFGQFERGAYEQQGSGLGLTIARRLTELHGGKLTIESQVGIGTTVRVQIPQVPRQINHTAAMPT
jgi:two-component system sensor histidine kinase/response regulator